MTTSNTSRLPVLFLTLGLIALAILLATLLATPSQAAPQSCSGLFMSEYIEGSSYNKAIEIFNGTGAAVDLSAYTLELYANGSSTPSQTMTLSGTVAHGDVYVIAHPNADAAILAQADATDSNVINFNGDDAVVLKQNGTVIDAIGQVGDDPGSAWSNNGVSTKDMTLRRKTTISTGDNDASDAFDPSVEWDGYAKDTFDGLGSHSAQCASGDVAPYVSSTDPADGAIGVAENANITITFNEAVNVSGEWFQIDCPTSGTRHVADATVSGGPVTFTIDPNADFAQNETCTVTVYAAQVTDQDSDDPPDNMSADYSWSFGTTGTAPACSTIPLIQGAGAASPCQQYVTNIRGCITGFTANGFFYQDVAGDGDPATSDGIFVYRGYGCNGCSSLSVGNIVDVDGDIIEYYDMTEFAYYDPSDNVYTIIDSGTDCGGAGLPAPVDIAPLADPNVDPVSVYEPYEGMRAKMSFNGFVVGPTKRFVSDHPAGDPEIAFVDQSSSIYGQRVFEADYPGYRGTNYISGAFDKDLPDVDFGDSIAATDLTGVLSYQFSKYTLILDGQMTQTLTVTDDADTEDAESAAADGEFTLCTFNIENMFDTVDDGDGDMGDWVPADVTEYNRMLEKRAKAIVNNLSNCTVIGVQEVEGKDPVWDDLVNAISAQGGPSYSYDYYESIDPRDITTGILYDPARVTLNASSQEQGCTTTDYGVNYSNADNTYGRVVPNPCTSGAYPLYNRPPYLAQLTLKNAAGDKSVDVSVIVNHFKSKRGDETKNLPRREAQAQHVVDIMQAEYDAGRTNSVALGDFNDVLGSTTLAQFDTNVGGEPLVNLYLAHVPESDRYSYIFSGESEVLDHFITTSDLDGYFMAGRAVHINADYPDVANMGSDNCTDCIFSAGVNAPQDDTAHRSSDHDPVLTRFSVCRILDAPATVGIAANTGVNGVDLSWSPVTSSDHYQVWEDAAPYFTPDTRNDAPLDTTSQTSYTHSNSLGDAAVNHFYLITTVNACGAASGYSQRVGEFDFALTPGVN